MTTRMVHQESAIGSPLCPDQPLLRHWAFAAVAAWGDIRVMLQDANMALPTAFMLDQLVAEFLADPLIQSDPQQRAIWANLRERIAPYLREEGLAETAPALAEQPIGGAR